jgi:hypothetical protein
MAKLAGKGVVDRGDVVEDRVLGSRVEPNALLHHGLAVATERQAGRFEIAEIRE